MQKNGYSNYSLQIYIKKKKWKSTIWTPPPPKVIVVVAQNGLTCIVTHFMVEGHIYVTAVV